MTDKYITIEKLADKSGVSIRTLRRYISRFRKHDPVRYDEITMTDPETEHMKGRSRVLFHEDKSLLFVEECKSNALYSQMKMLDGTTRRSDPYKPEENPDEYSNPSVVILREKIKAKEEGVRPYQNVFIAELTYEDQKNLIQLICDLYQNNEKSLRVLCAKAGIKVVDFMKLIVKNPAFRRMYEEANTIRQHVLLAELEYWEEFRILDQMKTLKTKTTSINSELIEETDDDGNKNYVSIPRAQIVQTRDFFPTPMALSLAHSKKQSLKAKLLTNDEIPLPDFRNMTPEQRADKIKELKLALEEKRRSETEAQQQANG